MTLTHNLAVYCENCKARIPSSKTRLRKVNSALYDIGTKYWGTMGEAFRAIDTALVSNGFEETNGAKQTAGTGTTFHACVDEEMNSWLHISWYRMPSGRYEVTAYVN